MSRRSKLRLPNQSVPPRFPEPPRFADHGSVRRSAPFPALRRHEPAEDGEQDGRHGSDLGPISTICRSGPPAFLDSSLSTRSSPPSSATPRADAAIEAPEQSVSSVLMMGEGGAHAPRAHLTCAHHISLRLRPSSHTTAARALSLNPPSTTRGMTLICHPAPAATSWQATFASFSTCSRARCGAAERHTRGGDISDESALFDLEQPDAGACLARHAADASPRHCQRAPVVDYVYFCAHLALTRCSSAPLSALLMRPCALPLRC